MLRFVFESGPADRLNRREWLRIGGLAGLGLSLPSGGVAARGRRTSVGVSPEAPALARPARSFCIRQWRQSQLKPGPKPDAPAEIRGAFGSVPRRYPAYACASTCRSWRGAPISTPSCVVSPADDRDHGSAAYLALTGQFHPRKSSNPPPLGTDFPTYGAVLHRVRPDKHLPYGRAPERPALVPELPAPGQFRRRAGTRLRAVAPRRRDARGRCKRWHGPAARPASVRQSARDRCCNRSTATALLHSDRATADLDIRRRQNMTCSPPRIAAKRSIFPWNRQRCDRYGRHRSGQACLLARRLVEAGVPMVTVMWSPSNRGQDKDPTQTDLYGWDTHNDIFEALSVHLLLALTKHSPHCWKTWINAACWSRRW